MLIQNENPNICDPAVKGLMYFDRISLAETNQLRLKFLLTLSCKIWCAAGPGARSRAARFVLLCGS